MNSLSIVIPTILSSEVLFKASLESALRQNCQPSKIIVFLNGVSAPWWLYNLTTTCENLYIFSSNVLLEAHASWTKAVGYSDTSFTFILGDDDILDPNFTEVALPLSKKHDLVNFQPRYINDTSRIIGSSPCTAEGMRMPYQLLIDRYSGCLDILVPGILFKTELFNAVNGFPDTGCPVSLYSDVLLFFKMASLNNGAYIYCNPLWSYRRHPLQLSFTNTYINITNKAVDICDQLISICLPHMPNTLVSGTNNIGLSNLRYTLISNMSANFSRRFFAKKLYKSGCTMFILSLGDVLHDIAFAKNLPLKTRLNIMAKSIKAWLDTGKKYLCNTLFT